MLDLTRLVAQTIVEEALEATQVPAESGLAYIRVAGPNGTAVVKPSTGAASEVFAGLAVLDKIATASGLRWMMEAVIANSDVTAERVVVLPDSAGIANLTVYGPDGTTVLTSGGVIANMDAAEADVAKYNVTGTTLTFGADYKGKSVYICYNYTLTPVQLQMLGVSPIASAASLIGSLALTKGLCIAYVNNFNASIAFAINDSVTLGANGTLTKGGTGTVIGKVVKVPTAADPFLGVEYVAGQ